LPECAVNLIDNGPSGNWAVEGNHDDVPRRTRGVAARHELDVSILHAEFYDDVATRSRADIGQQSNPLGLQQPEHPLPMAAVLSVTARLTLWQRSQSAGSRSAAVVVVYTGLLQPPSGPLLVWHPHARVQRGFAQVQGRDLLHLQVLLIDLLHGALPSQRRK
jgi:hypothetical protein